MSALGSDGIDGGSDDTADADIIPMMQGMMKSLLSKDILYPSLKDISAQVIKLCMWYMMIQKKTDHSLLIVVYSENRQLATYYMSLKLTHTSLLSQPCGCKNIPVLFSGQMLCKAATSV